MKNKIALFDLKENISEDNLLMKKNDRSSQSLDKAYNDWASQMLEPVFPGLESDKSYSLQHPNRFKKPE